MREIIDLLINFKQFSCVGENGYKTEYNHKNYHEVDTKAVVDMLVKSALKYAVSGFRFSRGGWVWGRYWNITATISGEWVYYISINVKKAFKNQNRKRLQKVNNTLLSSFRTIVKQILN